MVFSPDGASQRQVFVSDNKVNPQNNKNLQIVLLCDSKNQMTKEVADQIAKKIEPDLFKDGAEGQVHLRVMVDKEGNYHVSRPGPDQTIVKLTKEDVEASNTEVKIRELSIKTLEEKQKPEKKLNRFFSRFVAVSKVIAQGVSKLRETVVGQKPATKEMKNAVKLMGDLNQNSLCLQLEFVQKALNERNEGLAQAIANGRNLQAAAEGKLKPEKNKDATQTLIDQWRQQLHDGKTLYIPVGATNAHILVIQQKDNKLIIEQRSLAPSKGNTSEKTTGSTIYSTDSENFNNLIRGLIGVVQDPNKPPIIAKKEEQPAAESEEVEEAKPKEAAKDPVKALLDAHAVKEPAHDVQQLEKITTSDDPLKLIYQFVNDLKVKSGEQKINKTQFYRDYVEYLTNLYASKMDRLSTNDRASLLEGLSELVDNQLQNALTKEVGPIAAKEVIDPLKNWISNRRQELKVTTKAESETVKALNSPAEKVAVSLKTDVQGAEGGQQTAQSVQAHLDPQLMLQAQSLRQPNITKAQALQTLQTMDAKVNELLNAGKLAEARLLSISVLRAVPNADAPLWQLLNFEERKSYIASLSSLSYHFSEATALSGIPLQPFEAFEVQINIPLTIRSLIDKQCNEIEPQIKNKLKVGLQGMPPAEKYHPNLAGNFSIELFEKLEKTPETKWPAAFKRFMLDTQGNPSTRGLAFNNSFSGANLTNLMEEADRLSNGDFMAELWLKSKSPREIIAVANLTPTEAGYMILQREGGGGFDLKQTPLFVQDSSLMIGGDPSLQARYNAARNVYDQLKAKTSVVEFRQILFDSAAEHYGASDKDRRQVNAVYQGVQIPLKEPLNDLIPKEWANFHASMKMGWLAAAPGVMVEDIDTAHARNQFVQKAAGMKRMVLQQVGSDIAFVDPKGDKQLILRNDYVLHEDNKLEDEANKDRQHFMGALGARMQQAKVSDANDPVVKGMSEPGALREANENHGKWDPKYVHKMFEAGAIDMEAVGDRQFSKYSVVHTFDLINQYPYLLDEPAVQDRILQILSDRNVLTEALKDNPLLFRRMSPVLSNLIQQKLEAKDQDPLGALFLMDIHHRIYEHAKTNEDSIRGLKPYGIDNALATVNTLFDATKDPAEKTAIAGYVLRFYSNERPETLDTKSWARLLLAKATVSASPEHAGNPAILTTIQQKMQETYLPYLVGGKVDINAILNTMVKPPGQWEKLDDYRYKSGDRIVDLQTNQGFAPAAIGGERMPLPIELIRDPLLRRVFPELASQENPNVPAIKRQVGGDTVYEIQVDNVNYKIVQTSGESKLKLIQLQKGNEYRFAELDITDINESNAARLIRQNGVWINTKDPKEIRMAAKGVAIDDNAYYLNVNKNKIEISAGTGSEKKVVCADGENIEYCKAIRCVPAKDLICLKAENSKEKGINEIRFENGLEVVKQDGTWRLKGNEDYVWQTENTAELSARYGKEQGEWMMAFKNSKSGDQIVWMWPKGITSTGKRGADLEFKNSAATQPIVFTKQGQKESTTEAGFMYLAYVAYNKGNYALATEYLQKMENTGGKVLDQTQIQALREMALLFITGPTNTAAQNAVQLRFRLALADLIDKKLPLSEQKNFFNTADFSKLSQNYGKEFAKKTGEIFENLQKLPPSQKQALAREGIALPSGSAKIVDNLIKGELSAVDRIKEIDKKAQVPRVQGSAIPLITVEPKGQPSKWEAFFSLRNTTHLVNEIGEAVEYFQERPGMTTLEKADNEAIRNGIFEAANDMLGINPNDPNAAKGYLDLDRSKIADLKKQIAATSANLRSQTTEQERKILEGARYYAEEMNIGRLIASGTLDNTKLLSLVLDKYQDGELASLPAEEREAFEKLITEYLLASTELKQLENASNTLTRLENETEKTLGWAVGSQELLRQLSEGSNDSRHLDTDNKIDSKGRRYLVTEYRSGFITRVKAKQAIESMLDSDKKFVKVRMGLGKSTFIFPHLARFLLDRGKMPVVMFTEQLLEQTRAYMDPKAYVFQFDRDFGIDPAEKSRLSSAGMTKDEITIKHLTKLYDDLASLRSEGRYPITTPERLAALRNKKIELLRLNSQAIANNNPEGSKIFKQQIELLNKIEGVFKGPDVRVLQDEDVISAIDKDHDFAVENSVKMDSVNVEGAHFLMQQIFDSRDPDIVELKNKIINQQLSAMPAVEFEKSMRALANAAVDSLNLPGLANVDRNQLLDFLTGKTKTAPPGFPPYSGTPNDKRLAALKTYLSQTLPNLYKAQDGLDRGLADSNGCVVVPLQDGDERVGNRFGNQKEALMHAFLFYAANACTEEFFDFQLKVLRNSDKPFVERLENIRLEQGKKTLYEAFMTPQAAQLRTQFLLNLINNTDHYNINQAKINCNSQDIALGNAVNVASGTGDAFSLNLAERDKKAEPAVIDGETYLKMNLGRSADSFKNPYEYIQNKVKDNNCHAIMIQGYSIGNDTAKLVSQLREAAPNRQFLFPDPDRNNRIMMWLPGADSPVPFDRSRIDLNLCINIYGAMGTRGTDIPIKQGQDVYVVNMVGPGTKKEAANQSAWRARQLGSGQRLVVAYHEDMKSRIAENNGLKPPFDIKAGHVMNDVVIESRKYVGNSRQKALLFTAQSHLKQYAYEVISTPSTTKDQPGISMQERVQGALFEAYQPLFVKGIEEDWESQYGSIAELNPKQYHDQIHASELKKVQQIDEAALFNVAAILTDKDGLENLKLLRELPSGQRPDRAFVEQRFKEILEPFKDKPEEYNQKVDGILNGLNKEFKLLQDLKLIRSRFSNPPKAEDFRNLSNFKQFADNPDFLEAINQFQKSYLANKQAKQMIQEAFKQTEDPELVAFLNANLPAKITIGQNDQGSQVQVQVEQQQQQQQQQQQMQQQQAQVNQVVSNNVGETYKPPKAISLNDFIHNTPGTSHYDLDKDYESRIPYCYKSPRAKELLKENASNPGVPLVYRLVIQDPATGKIRTCLITPSDYTDGIGEELKKLRSDSQSNLQIGVYPLTKGTPAYDATNKAPDSSSKAFLAASAWDKLLVGCTEFSAEEKQFLQEAIPNMDEIYDDGIFNHDQQRARVFDPINRQFNAGIRTPILIGATGRMPTVDTEENDEGIRAFELRDVESLNTQVLAYFEDAMRYAMRQEPSKRKEAFVIIASKLKDYGKTQLLAPQKKAPLKLKENPYLKQTNQSKMLDEFLAISSQKEQQYAQIKARLEKFAEVLETTDDPNKLEAECENLVKWLSDQSKPQSPALV